MPLRAGGFQANCPCRAAQGVLGRQYLAIGRQHATGASILPDDTIDPRAKAYIYAMRAIEHGDLLA